MNWKEYGERIKKSRQKKDLLQKELAEKLGCSSAFVSQLEAGIRRPSAEMLLKIREVLCVDFF